MNIIDHDAQSHSFSTSVDGMRAVLEYSLAQGVMTITHTGVPQQIGGRGVAAELMRAALKTARDAGWRVVPQCSYAAAYLRRHSDAQEHEHENASLDEAIDESFPASDSRSIGGSN